MKESTNLLTKLAQAISEETVKIIDLSNTLSSDFPVIILPPEFGQCEQFKMETCLNMTRMAQLGIGIIFQ